MSWRQERFGCRCVLALAAAAVLMVPARAQNIRSVVFITVKPDRQTDFLAATKDIVAAETKGGSDRAFTTWRSQSGPTEFALVRNYSKWADLENVPEPKMKDLAATVLGINTRIVQCEERSHREIDELIPDSSLPQTGELPKMIQVTRTRVLPGKGNEYVALVKSEVLPAAQKSGLKVYSISHVGYGAPSSEYIGVAGMNGWADLDGGTWVQKAMGPEGYQRFLTKLRALTIESEFNIYRLVPDSSYFPAAK